MKNNGKKMAFILILILILILVAFFSAITIYLITEKQKEAELDRAGNVGKTNAIIEKVVQTLEDGTRLNTSNALNKEREWEGLKITHIQLTNRENKTELIANIQNPTNQDKPAMLVDIILYDKDGNPMATLGGRISPIKAGQTIQFSTSAMRDYTNAYDFEIKLK